MRFKIYFEKVKIAKVTIKLMNIKECKKQVEKFINNPDYPHTKYKKFR